MISFASFLKNIRMDTEVALDDLARGICSASELSMIEAGERGAEKLLRDRLLARLGLSGNSYEEYLQPDEYEAWEVRQRMVCALEDGAYDEAERLLDDYERMAMPEQKMDRQFCLVMRAELRRHAGADAGELAGIYREAMKLSIPHLVGDDSALPESLLATQEWNLLLEYRTMCLWDAVRRGDANRTDADDWFRYYLRSLRESDMEELEQAKLVPKTVVRYGQMRKAWGGERAGTPEALLTEALRALELLRKQERGYYLTELLRILEELLPGEARYGECRETLEELHRRYGLRPEMTGSAYLYREMYAHSLGEVVRERRKMFGWTQEALAEGICSAKTVKRIENGKVRAHPSIVRDLFVRLNLTPDFAHTEVIAEHRDALELVDRIRKYSRGEGLEERRRLLAKLRAMISEEEIINRQFLARVENDILRDEGGTPAEQICKNLNDALKLSLGKTEYLESDPFYFTQDEIEVLQNIAIVEYEEWHRMDMIRLLERILEKQYSGEVRKMSHFGMYAFLTDSVANWLGSEGDFEISNAMSEALILRCLKNKFFRNLSTSLYNLTWNDREMNGKKNATLHRRMLESCVRLAYLCDMRADENFFQERLENW